MSRDLLISSQVTRSGHSDGDREEEVTEIDVSGGSPAWSESQEARSLGQPARSL